MMPSGSLLVDLGYVDGNAFHDLYVNANRAASQGRAIAGGMHELTSTRILTR
jgi:hypothetical protein